MQNKKKNTIIGIDVSKATLDIWDTQSHHHKTFDNSCDGLKKLMKSFSDPSTCTIILEATGVYHRLSHKMLVHAGFSVSVVNPYRSRKFADILGKLAKTDKVDSKVLATYGQCMDLPITPLPSDQIETLKEFVLKRRQLVELKKTVKIQSQDICSANLKEMSSQHEHFLKAQIQDISLKIEGLISSCPSLKNKFDIMKSIKGVGPILAATLLADMQELGNIDGKQASSLCGVAPFNWDSGVMRGKRMIKGGRHNIRTVLYMSALTASRCNKDMKNIYDRLVKKGKAKKVALVAVMRKMIVLINALLRENRPWLENMT